jgi:hypothetical protein
LSSGRTASVTMSDISHLPLDIFEDDAVEASSQDAWCQWCGAARPASDTSCEVCGGRLIARNLSAAAVPETARLALLEFEHCPWCQVDVSPEHDRCPACFANLRVDPDHNIPGVNVPLSDAQLRELAAAYQQLDAESDPTGPLLDILLVAARLVLGVRF